MKRFTVRDESRSADLAWVDGTLPRAGIYLLDGRCQVAALGSAAEDRLLARGALAIATVTFDGSGGEGPAPVGPRFHSLRGRSAAAVLRWPPSRN